MRNYNTLKNHCRRIFLIGTGTYWYEDNDSVGNDKRVWYRVYNCFIMFLYVIMVLFEVLAAAFGDLPDDEHRDSVSLASSHSIILFNIFTLIYKKDLVKALNKKMVEVCEKHENPTLMEEQYTFIKINVIVYMFLTYGSMFLYVFEGLRKYFSGSHFIVVITYYPSYGDNSSIAVLTRILSTICLFHMVLTMIVSVNSLAVNHLIMYKYKFMTLKQYFEKLGRDVAKKIQLKDEIGARERLYTGLLEGIRMHSDVLSLMKNIDNVFGNIMAFHLCLSFCTAISLLLQIALTEEFPLVATFGVLFYASALFFLLGSFLCNAGEITYQASLIPNAIFHCGWHLCPNYHRGVKIGTMVSFSIAQAQKPVVMKAFKTIELTYSTYISVIKSTYSVFALIHAQQK